MGALDGLKILDFTTLLPGPYATLLLADLGAEVLRVTRPGSHDLVTNWGKEVDDTGVTGVAAWLGRNKESIFLNLKKPEAVAAVKRLVEEYDIVIEQFRPGVMERLGLGYEDLKALKPDIIYCSLTGYGQTGPMRDVAGHDCNYLAKSGILSAAGRKEGGPALYNFQIADVAAGANNAVIGILAAVCHRQRTGEGQYIDIAMCDGVVPFNSMDGAAFLAGEDAPEREDGLLNGGWIYDYYETSDGGYMSVGSLEPKFYTSLCDALELPEWKDMAYARAHADEVKDSIRRRFKTKTKKEWTDIFEKTDACVEPVLTMEEAVRDPQLRERGMWQEVPFSHVSHSPVMQYGCPIRLSATPPEYHHAGYPDGYQTEEILGNMGYSKEDIIAMSS